MLFWMRCVIIRKDFDMKISKEELISLSGGGFNLAASIGAAIAFFISVIDGFLNPIRCINDFK